jgi:hypothetical protein
VVYAHVPKEKRHKLQEKAVKCRFLGYSDTTKGYRLLNLSTKKIFYSRDVKFMENILKDDKIEIRLKRKSQIELDEEKKNKSNLEIERD